MIEIKSPWPRGPRPARWLNGGPTVNLPLIEPTSTEPQDVDLESALENNSEFSQRGVTVLSVEPQTARVRFVEVVQVNDVRIQPVGTDGGRWLMSRPSLNKSMCGCPLPCWNPWVDHPPWSWKQRLGPASAKNWPAAEPPRPGCEAYATPETSPSATVHPGGGGGARQPHCITVVHRAHARSIARGRFARSEPRLRVDAPRHLRGHGGTQPRSAERIGKPSTTWWYSESSIFAVTNGCPAPTSNIASINL